MTNPPLTLVVLAAGRSSRYGRPKQLDPVGPGGHSLMEYGMFDAARAGFEHVVLVIAREMAGPFEERLSSYRGAGITVSLVDQSLTDLPDGYAVPDGRDRPWGTGHAVLAAHELIRGPFGVCNADDFYGRSSFERLASALRRSPDMAVAVGFPLATTLAESGGVSRGLMRIDDAGQLTGVTEGLGLSMEDGVVVGRDPVGNAIEASPDQRVSMNLWGFPASFVSQLEAAFLAFLRGAPGPDDEFYLSEAVDDLLAAGALRCRHVPATDPWVGMTHPADRERVARVLSDLVESGVYPEALFATSPGPTS